MDNFAIGLDIDGVLANWSQAFIERARDLGLGEHFPSHWTEVQDWMFGGEHFDTVWREIENDHEFWLNIKPRDTAHVDFPVKAYITHRPVPSAVTEAWLERHGFPAAPVYTVENSKVEAAKAAGIDVFVDDKEQNFRELNDAGVFCLLFDCPHNGGIDDMIRFLYGSGDGFEMVTTPGRVHYLREIPYRVKLIQKYGRLQD